MFESHLPVLCSEFLSFFRGQRVRFFVDGTVGGGGHSEALLHEHPELEVLIGIDRDPRACSLARERLRPWGEKVFIYEDSYEFIGRYLQEHQISCVDGILLDLGVSSMQLDSPERGFSFSKEGPLDMRMSPSNPLTAEEIVNDWSEKELGKIFRDYGEERKWRRAVATIVAARREERIVTTGQLAALLEKSLKRNPRKPIHPATRIFQALRICVNEELGILTRALGHSLDLLCPGGRMAVISFHSLEDRLTKNAFRKAASDKQNTSGLGGLFLDKEPLVKILTKKPVEATNEEMNENPRCRSAKMRVVERIGR